MMQRIDGIPTSRAGGTAHPAILAALAIGIAIGASFSSVPARSAEAGGSAASAAEPSGPAPQSFGTAKRVQAVRIAADHAAAASAPVATANWHYDGDAEYRSCIDRSDGTNVAWGACGGSLIEREDARLNAAWRRVYAPDAEAKSKELLDEQRAWILFKEVSCRFYASGSFGREGQVLSFPVCRAGIIAQRTATLGIYESGDEN